MIGKSEGLGVRRVGARAARSSERDGSVLVIVLWVLALMAMYVASLAFDMHIEARITSTWRKKLKAEYVARSGIELARMALQETGDPDVKNTLDAAVYLAKGSETAIRQSAMALAQGGGAELTRQVGEGTVQVTIRPENAKMNVNNLIHATDRALTYQEWDPLFETAGVPREKRDALVDCLLDWVDQDEMTHLSGAESDYYESLDPPYKCKNGLLDVIDELALVKGFDEVMPDTGASVYDIVSTFLTTYSDDAKLNINAVSVETLMPRTSLPSGAGRTALRARKTISPSRIWAICWAACPC